MVSRAIVRRSLDEARPVVGGSTGRLVEMCDPVDAVIGVTHEVPAAPACDGDAGVAAVELPTGLVIDRSDIAVSEARELVGAVGRLVLNADSRGLAACTVRGVVAVGVWLDMPVRDGETPDGLAVTPELGVVFRPGGICGGATGDPLVTIFRSAASRLLP